MWGFLGEEEQMKQRGAGGKHASRPWRGAVYAMRIPVHVQSFDCDGFFSPMETMQMMLRIIYSILILLENWRRWKMRCVRFWLGVSLFMRNPPIPIGNFHPQWKPCKGCFKLFPQSWLFLQSGDGKKFGWLVADWLLEEEYWIILELAGFHRWSCFLLGLRERRQSIDDSFVDVLDS